MKRLFALLLAMVMVLSMAACGNDTPETTGAPETTLPADTAAHTEESFDGKLVSEGMMDIQYATQFTIELFKGGYRMVNDQLSGGRILVVPEGMSVPAELEESVQVLQLPVTNAYICGTNVVGMCDAIGAVDKVTLVGADSKFHFDSINAQLESGHTQFAGGYTSDPDYEMIATSGTQLVVWNGTEEEVLQKFHELGISQSSARKTPVSPACMPVWSGGSASAFCSALRSRSMLILTTSMQKSKHTKKVKILVSWWVWAL